MRIFPSLFALCSVALLFPSCKEKWNESDKKAFYTACTETARKDWADSDTLAKTYCDCLFEKMAKKYPEEEEMLLHIDQLAKDTDLIKCRDEVMHKK
jgi:hypothetical protein